VLLAQLAVASKAVGAVDARDSTVGARLGDTEVVSFNCQLGIWEDTVISNGKA
jgi:hypothetical protein